jgi:hypothetical protein
LFLLKEFGKIVTGKKKEKEAAKKLIDWRYRPLTEGSNPTSFAKHRGFGWYFLQPSTVPLFLSKFY